MAFIPCPNCVEIELRSVWEGQHVENTLWFQLQGEGSIDATALATLNSDVAGFYSAMVVGNLTSSYSFQESFARAMNSESDLTNTYVTGLPVVGGNSGLSAANNVALCVSFRTGLSGRSFRGRNFVGGIPAEHVAHNLVSSDFTAPVLTSYNSLQGIVNGDGWDWVVVSRFHDGLPRLEGVASKIQVALLVDNVVDSQRRRLPGRGS